MNRPTLSVCIPTFERPALVEQAIRSVVASGRWRADEVEIVVSDNSPDASEDACRRALAAWPGRSLYIANRPNIGMVANFNQCLARASGRWVLFVHDDDRVFPAAIPDMLYTISAAPEHQRALLFGVQIVDEHGRLVRRRDHPADVELEPPAAVRRLLSDVVFAPFPGLVVRAVAYAEVGPFDAGAEPATDLDMWLRLFGRFGVRCVPLTTSIYVVQPESATAAIDYDGQVIGRLSRIFDAAAARAVLPAGVMARCRAEFFHQVILGATYSALRAGDVGRARRTLRLFELPEVDRLGHCRRWLPFRLLFGVLLPSPAPIVRATVGLSERFELVRLLRGTT